MVTTSAKIWLISQIIAWLKIQLLRDVTPCRLVNIYKNTAFISKVKQCKKSLSCSNLNMKALRSSETSSNFYRNISKYLEFYQHLCDNLKPRKELLLTFAFMLPSATFLLDGLPGHKAIEIIGVLRQIPHGHNTPVTWIRTCIHDKYYWVNYQDLLGKAQGYVCPSVRLCLAQARKPWTRLLRLEMNDNLHSLLHLCVLKSTLGVYALVQLFEALRYKTKVADSIPDSVTGIFHRLITSGLTLALGSLSL